MAKYKLTKENQSIIRKADGACIPLALGNRDYSEYLEWLAEGNVPEPAQTLEEIAAEQAVKTKELKGKNEIQEVKTDPKIQALIEMTPTEVKAWVNNEGKTVAKLQEIVTLLAVAVSVLGRRL